MKKIKRVLTITIAACAAFFGLIGRNNAFADGNPYVLSAVNWTVDVGNLNPGDKTESSYKIKNAGTEAFTYEAVAKPYTMADENGETSFDTTTPYNLMRDWVTFKNPTGTVEAGAEHTIYFTVNVPKDVPAGSQYVALHTTAYPSKKEESSGSNIQALVAVAPLLKANINGETRASGIVSENRVPAFFLEPKITTSAMVENNGNVGFDVKYFLQVFPLFSDEELYTNEEDPASNLVMPEAKRYIEQSWDEAPTVGIFKVRQTVKVYDKEFVNEKIAVICPLWLIALVALIIIAIAIWLVARAKSRKK